MILPILHLNGFCIWSGPKKNKILSPQWMRIFAFLQNVLFYSSVMLERLKRIQPICFWTHRSKATEDYNNTRANTTDKPITAMMFYFVWQIEMHLLILLIHGRCEYSSDLYSCCNITKGYLCISILHLNAHIFLIFHQAARLSLVKNIFSK